MASSGQKFEESANKPFRGRAEWELLRNQVVGAIWLTLEDIQGVKILDEPMYLKVVNFDKHKRVVDSAGEVIHRSSVAQCIAELRNLSVYYGRQQGDHAREMCRQLAARTLKWPKSRSHPDWLFEIYFMYSMQRESHSHREVFIEKGDLLSE